MAAGPKVSHPASKYFPLLICLSLFAWVLSLIAIFVPWSWKDTAVFERTTVGLWKNCRNYVNDPLKMYTCYTNDIDQVGSVSGGDMKCRGYIVATQVFTVSAVVLTFLTLLLAIYLMTRLWSKPVLLTYLLATLAMLAFGCCLTAFLMWIVFAEQYCQTRHPLFPLKGYSWGWICMVVATAFTFAAWLLAYLALWAIMRFKPFIPHEEPAMYPAATAMTEVCYPAGIMGPTATPVGSYPPVVSY